LRWQLTVDRSSWRAFDQHYQRLLNYIKPHFVHVFYNGCVVKSGGPELALELEERGYQDIRQQFGEPMWGQEIA
jgi:Fe-S cluster assembly ATPase SufC